MLVSRKSKVVTLERNNFFVLYLFSGSMKDRFINIVKKVFKNKHCKLWLIALIATIPVLIYEDIPVSHDILFHLSRIKGISYEIGNNNFFSPIYHSFLNNLGYASPLFYPDIFLYPFAFLYKVFSLGVTYKLLMFFVNLVTVYVINFVLEKKFNDYKIINLGTILYVFSAYRMTNMYVRGCLGECLAFIFLPLIILGIDEIVHGNKNNYYYLVIGMTGILYSHIIASFLAVILIFSYLLFNIKKIFQEKRYLYLILSVILTFLLTSSFLLPLFEQMLDRDFYIHYLDQTNTFNNIYVPLYKLFVEIPLPSNVWLPLGIGIVYIYFLYLGYKYRRKIKYRNLVFAFLGCLFLLCSTSLLPRFIYNNFLFLIQYQWRFYLLATVLLFTFGMTLMKLLSDKEKNIVQKIIFASSLVVLTVTTTNGMIYRQTSEIDSEYLGFYEYLPKGVEAKDVINKTIIDFANNEVDYNYSFVNDKIILEYANNYYDDTVITLPLLYYKGYTVDKKYNVINNNGLVSVMLEEVNDKIVVYYERTTTLLVGRIITFTTLIVIICVYIRKKGDYVKIKSRV